ncbi:developmental regulatory [Venturia nashicola]|uniref:Developmental regulatory n=1 Tax=Venturia nashicola TaxID=86259 RepID=A0A4Z1NNV0_9PEZI|nr:developmental regulatory [Venturia nashicola]
MSFETVPSSSWEIDSFQQQHRKQPDISTQPTSSDSRWAPSSEDFFDSFVNTESSHGRNGEDPSDFPLDYPSMTELIPESHGNDTSENAFLCSNETIFNEAQNSWHDSAMAGDTHDPALPSFEDAFSSNYAPSGSFLSTENDPLLSLDPFHSHTELDLVALPGSPSKTPVWSSNHDDLQETTLPAIDTQTRRASLADDFESNRLSRHSSFSRERGRQLSRNHTMLAQRWEDSALADQGRAQSFSNRKEAGSISRSSHLYRPCRGDCRSPPPSRLYQQPGYQLEPDSAPLYRDTTRPEEDLDDMKLKQSRTPHSPVGSTVEARGSSFPGSQPGLTFSSYPSTPRSHAEGPDYPMTSPHIQATESQPWNHPADALQNSKAEDWWSGPTGQSEATCDATITPRTLGFGITNMHPSNLGDRVAYSSDRQFSPDAMNLTSTPSKRFSYGSGASASFDSVYTAPQAQMLPMQPQQRVQTQAYNQNEMVYQPNPANFSPAQMSHRSFNSPVPMTALPYLNNTQRASSMTPSTRASSIVFSRASSYRSTLSPSPGPPHDHQPQNHNYSHSLPRSSNRRDQRKQNRRSASRATHHSRESSRTGAAEMGGFINYTPSDKKRILTGVAPSGSAKTKARREKEAADQKRKMSEAAKRAVLTGDMTLLERSFG